MRENDRRQKDEAAEQLLVQQREADLASNRIEELREKPIAGHFDGEHLRAVHAYIFQDLPHHRPGVTRDDTADTWIKHRGLENISVTYDVPYVSNGVATRIDHVLDSFGGVDTIKGLSPDQAAERIAQLYGDLDHAHGFYEGNSRTLREFTRELADRAGFDLDWVRTSVGTKERNELYLARDLAVLERAYPDLTPERAMETNNRAEYEASFVIERLRISVGGKDLASIVRDNVAARDFVGEKQHGPETPVIDNGLQVADAATGAVSKLGDFVLELLAGSSRPAPVDERAAMQALASDPATRRQQRHASIAASRQGEAARRSIERIREDMEAGRNLKAEDIRSLTRQHQEQISTFGDTAVRQIVEDARKRDEGYWRGREREKD